MKTQHTCRPFGKALPVGAICFVLAGAGSPSTARPDKPRSHGDSNPIVEVRTIDGINNNPSEPLWGAAGESFVRFATVAYEDGVSLPSGNDRPGARAVSNAVCAQTESLPNDVGYTDYLWQWGQFLDHDITETPLLDPAEPFNIPVPTGDIWFDPTFTGTVIIPMNRSFHETDQSGVAQQVNLITAYVDASNVYGSDEERAHTLRANDGTGRLKISDGDLLPYNTEGLENAGGTSATLFLAGDVRANEQIYLTAMHTLFVREHNHWADLIREQSNSMKKSRFRERTLPGVTPDMSGDDVYELARAIVGAEMQVITYRDFLGTLLGHDALPPYRGYRPNINAGITNVFATAAFRLGHTMLSSELLRLDRNGEPIEAGNIALANAFFSPSEITDNGGIEPLLRGLAAQPAQSIDPHLVDDVRNFLFGPPGSGGFDLASLNIQRGRDHGLPSYNQVRADFGLNHVSEFSEISRNPERQASLSSVYASPDDIDPWVGMLSEDHVPGALVGETLFTILIEQFGALRDGDRFWYQNSLPRELQNIAEAQTLAGIIRRNTTIRGEIQDDVFKVRQQNEEKPPHRERDRRSRRGR